MQRKHYILNYKKIIGCLLLLISAMAFAADLSAISSQEEGQTMKVTITVGDINLEAEFENNAATRKLIEQMPFTYTMRNLYSRELCYRMGPNALPTDHIRNDGYQIGDIVYWPPMGSLVILYKQDGELFARQHLGRITSLNILSKLASLSDSPATFRLKQ